MLWSNVCCSISIGMLISINFTLACISEKSSEFWFGTFITCLSESSYTKAIAKNKCPTSLFLAEIMDASLYGNISQEISLSTE